MRRKRPRLRKFSEGANALRRVEIFSTGEHHGKGYTAGDLNDIARNFRQFSTGKNALVRPPLFEVPASLGHEEEQKFLERSDLPAAAWPNRVWVEDCEGKDGVVRPTLLADFEDVPEETMRLVRGRRYRTISAEIYDEPPPGVAGKGKMLRRIALLGADIPEVKTLSDIPVPSAHAERRRRVPVVLKFSEVRQSKTPGAYWVFSEVVTMDRAAMIEALVEAGVDQALITDAVPDPLLAEWLRTLDDTDPGTGTGGDDPAKLAEEEPPAKPTDAESAKKFADYASRMAAKFGCKMDDKLAGVAPADPVKLHELVRKAVAEELKTGVAKDLKEFEKFAEGVKAEQKRAQIDAFCKAELAAGRIMPRELDRADPANLFDELMRTDAATVVHKFKEGKTTVEATALDLKLKQIRNRPVLVRFGEHTKAGGTGGDDEAAKVEQFAQRPEIEAALKANGQTPTQYVAKFSELKKKKPDLTAAEYGVRDAV